MDLVTVAIAVSRVEAVVVASMLEGYGIPVHVGADGHGGVEYNSLALGGYRLRVPEADWHAASDILRDSAARPPEELCTGPRRAIMRFWAAALAAQAAFLLPTLAAIGSLPAQLALAPLSIIFVPVNPQGRADYFLAPAAVKQ